MKRLLGMCSVAAAAACAAAAPNAAPTAAPSASIGQSFQTGLCPSDVPMPDTMAPLKVASARLRWADENYQPGFRVFGHVVARFTVDTTGHVEPGSAVIVTSDNPELSLAYCQDLLRQRFTPYRVGDDARRVRIVNDVRLAHQSR